MCDADVRSFFVRTGPHLTRFAVSRPRADLRHKVLTSRTPDTGGLEENRRKTKTMIQDIYLEYVNTYGVELEWLNTLISSRWSFQMPEGH